MTTDTKEFCMSNKARLKSKVRRGRHLGKCGGCMRGSACQQKYWKDGVCPYRVEFTEYCAWGKKVAY